MSIEYVGKDNVINVVLDGKLVGYIKEDGKLFYYQPKGSRIQGERFRTLRELKDDIEGIAKDG